MDLEQHLKHLYIQRHPLEAARHLESFSSVVAYNTFKDLTPEVIALALEHYFPAHMADVLTHFPPHVRAKIISQLSPMTARAVLRQFDQAIQSTLLSELDPAIAPYLRRTLNHPDHTAGSLADPRVLTLPPDMTVAQALNRIGQDCRQAIYYLYIIDHQTTLHGVVLMKELLTASPDSSLQSIMNPKVQTIPAVSNAQDLPSHPAWQVFDSLPVVEQGRSFIGVLRYRTLRTFIETRTEQASPEYFSDALLQLWEAYSLSGIGLMTTLGEVLQATTQQKPFEANKETP